MAAQKNKEMVTISLDGRHVRAAYRETVLAVAQRIGIPIPTLCHHAALEPSGACRLCLVEVEKRGRTRIVTACNYPVEDGLVVRTNSAVVARQRRMTMESLLARCPEVPEIRQLARSLGVEATRMGSGDDTCILCGLCTRVCESYATTAIATLNRGAEKVVGSFGDEAPAECVGCQACAEICPTGHIKTERKKDAINIWGKDFPLALCRVDEDLCRGCGACEEACPFSVARISLRRSGATLAGIDRESCKGCGVCLSACPTGAISQPGTKREVETGEGLLVLSCARSELVGPFAKKLPAGVTVLELPCTGAASVAQILKALATGHTGVLVMGRHEQTCRLDGSEGQARLVAHQAEQLARLVGLGAERVRFAQPAPGRSGPLAEIDSFRETLSPNPLGESFPRERFVDSLDGAVRVLTWLSAQPDLTPAGDFWLTAQELPVALPGEPVLVAGGLPYFDILFGDTLAECAPGQILAHTLAVLRAKGIKAGVAIGGFRAGNEKLAKELAGSPCYHPCRGCATALSEAGLPTIAIDELLQDEKPSLGDLKVAVVEGDEESCTLADALGLARVSVVPAPGVGLDFTITPADQQALAAGLVAAADQGATHLLVSGPAKFFQYQLVCRKGAWRQSHVRPILAATLAAGFLTEVKDR